MAGTAYFALGYACNHNCIICPVSAETKKRKLNPISDEEIDNWIKSLKNNDVTQVTLSGGEPTIQPVFFSVLNRLSDLNVDVTILSNGEMFAEQELIERILDVFPKERLNITTAFHASNAQLHERICGRKGSFAKTIIGCNNIINAGIGLTLKHCIHGMNADDSEAFMHFINNTFPEYIPLVLCEIDYVGIKESDIDKVILPFEMLGNTIEKSLELQEEYQKMGCRRRVIVAETPLCIVDPYFWKYFSCNMSQKTAVYAENKDGVRLSLNLDSECCHEYNICNKCRVRESCPGTWKSSVQYLTEDGLKCI